MDDVGQTKWVKALQRGEQPEANSARLFKSLYPSSCRFFRRRGFSLQDSEDLAQEALVAALSEIHRLKSPASFRSWFLAILVNIFRNEVRRRTRARRTVVEVPLESIDDELSPLVFLQDAQPLPDRRIADHEAREHLHQAVSNLPDRMRQCLELRLYQGRKFREIATILKISIGTVKAHIAQGKERVLDELRNSSNANLSTSRD